MGPGEGVGDSACREGQHLAGSGRHWLSWLEAGTPLNLHRAAPSGQSHLADHEQSSEDEFAAG